MPKKNKTKVKKTKVSKKNQKSLNNNKSLNNKNNNNNNFTSKKDCNELEAWHFPWNYKKYKSRCNDKGCVWTGSVMGSYCNDKKTATNNKLKYIGLEDPIYLASLDREELLNILDECNMAGEKYLVTITKKYKEKRINNIESIVVNPNINLLLKIDDDKIYKIISNARKEKLKDIKSFEDLKYRKIVMKENCFNRKLGSNPFRYVDKTRYDVINDLNECGIKQGEKMYNIAMYNYTYFSKYNKQ
jgi:hypothetical protein